MKSQNGKRTAVLALCLVALLMLPTFVNAQDSLRMRVMSFNIRYKNTIDSINGWEFRKENVARLIQYHGAAVAGLQEAMLDQIADLEKLLPEYAWYGVPRMQGPSAECTPIFYLKEIGSASCRDSIY